MAKGKTKKNKAAGKIKVNFEGVQSSNRVPEGDYPVKVASIEQDVSESSDKPYLRWQLEITEGTYKGKKLRHITSLQPQALFNLRNTLEALGITVPESSLTLELDELIGAEMAVAVEIEKYQGRPQSRVVDVFPLSELEDDEEEDDEELEEDEETEDEDDDDSDDEDDSNDDDSDEDEDDEEEDEDSDDEDSDDDDEDDFESMTDEELVDHAKSLGIKPKYKGKGKTKKLNREATIELIEEEEEE